MRMRIWHGSKLQELLALMNLAIPSTTSRIMRGILVRSSQIDKWKGIVTRSTPRSTWNVVVNDDDKKRNMIWEKMKIILEMGINVSVYVLTTLSVSRTTNCFFYLSLCFSSYFLFLVVESCFSVSKVHY